MNPINQSNSINPTNSNNPNRLRAICPVHLYGQPADMDPILEVAREKNLVVIEDACQAHGALYKDKKAGSIGTAGCFSFYPGKNLGACGEGGAVVTDDEDIYQKIRMIRDHGQEKKYFHMIEGYNGRLDAIQAGVLLYQTRTPRKMERGPPRQRRPLRCAAVGNTPGRSGDRSTLCPIGVSSLRHSGRKPRRAPKIPAGKRHRHRPALPPAAPPTAGLCPPRLQKRRFSSNRIRRRATPLAPHVPRTYQRTKSSTSAPASKSSLRNRNGFDFTK